MRRGADTENRITLLNVVGAVIHSGIRPDSGVLLRAGDSVGPENPCGRVRRAIRRNADLRVRRVILNTVDFELPTLQIVARRVPEQFREPVKTLVPRLLGTHS